MCPHAPAHDVPVHVQCAARPQHRRHVASPKKRHAVGGEGVAIPIRVALDTLEEDKRPASDDPIFSELWQTSGGEEDMTPRIVKRWRSQGR